MIWPLLVFDWLLGGLSEQAQPTNSLTRRAATDMSAIGWGKDCKQFRLSHKPGVAGLHCGG